VLDFFYHFFYEKDKNFLPNFLSNFLFSASIIFTVCLTTNLAIHKELLVVLCQIKIRAFIIQQMSLIESIILGIIQGLTEFLPVSSSGHLELGKAILKVKLEDDLLFSIIVHAATTLSTIVIFRNDIILIIKDLLKFEWSESTQFAAKIILSMIPVGLVGLLFKDVVEGFFQGDIRLVGSMLCVTGVLLLFTHFAKASEGEVTFWRAAIIGIAQAIAIIPGISRSGATISTAILIGTDRSKAARFSFLMVIPPIIGATLLEVKDYWEALQAAQPTSSDLSPTVLGAGFIASFIAGLFACRLMIELVKKGKLIYFAIYCFVIGISSILFLS
jgi:undecaprenyl-diphosphatase